jgi:hypothetical protein
MTEPLHLLEQVALRNTPEQEIERVERAYEDELASYVALQTETS